MLTWQSLMLSQLQETANARTMQILRRHNLLVDWSYVKAHNPGHDLPYHNNQHLMNMIRMSADIAAILEANYEYHVDFKVMLLAAMFHDFDHSGGVLPDSSNIQRAVAGWHVWAENVNYSNSMRVSVERAIRCTQYPFVIEPSTKEQRILRDADLMSSLEPLGVPMLMHGLRAELAIAGRPMTLQEFADGQLSFIDSIGFFTPAADSLYHAARVHMQAVMQQYAKEHQ